MNEAEIRADHIDPALRAVGRSVVESWRILLDGAFHGVATAKAYAKNELENAQAIFERQRNALTG